MSIKHCLSSLLKTAYVIQVVRISNRENSIICAGFLYLCSEFIAREKPVINLCSREHKVLVCFDLTINSMLVIIRHLTDYTDKSSVSANLFLNFIICFASFLQKGNTPNLVSFLLYIYCSSKVSSESKFWKWAHLLIFLITPFIPQTSTLVSISSCISKTSS
jgi:hypothetical protein